MPLPSTSPVLPPGKAAAGGKGGGYGGITSASKTSPALSPTGASPRTFGASAEPGMPTAHSSTENTTCPAWMKPGMISASKPSESASSSAGHITPGGAPTQPPIESTPRPPGPPGMTTSGPGRGPYIGKFGAHGAGGNTDRMSPAVIAPGAHGTGRADRRAAVVDREEDLRGGAWSEDATGTGDQGDGKGTAGERAPGLTVRVLR
jgi:hypothetical protein